MADTANTEAIEAWDGPLFDRWVQFRHILVDGLKAHGDAAMRWHPPAPGDRVLDIGCGLGDTTQDLARLVGGGGFVLGVDASPRFVQAAAEEAEGIPNVAFEVRDVEAGGLAPGAFDRAFSRMGTMFFANPTHALRNVREALVPGGELVMVVWRAKVENDWMYRPQTIVERFVQKPEEYDQPTCGPGPFSMANADTVSGILLAAGYRDVVLRRSDLPITIGRDVEEAVDLVTAIGPAGEILRLSGDRAAHLHEPVRDALREGLGAWAGPDGAITAPASTWIVSATA